MTCDLGSDWPFAGSITHVIDVVDGDVLFTLTLDALEPQPAQVGWHPWFLPPRHSHHNFTAMLQKDVSGITTNQRVPVPHRKYDDCFVKPITMPWLTIGEVKVEISSDCSHWVIYNANPAGICFEPQSGPPNGINTEPYVVMPGKPLVRHMAITRIS
jgi:aldose 1-epimerase